MPNPVTFDDELQAQPVTFDNEVNSLNDTGTGVTNAPKGGTPYNLTPSQVAMLPGRYSGLNTAEIMGGSALDNLPSSALNFGTGFVHSLLHPIDTATALGSTITGEGEKALGTQRQDEAPYADAFNAHYARYGSVAGIKNAIETDPVGTAADAAMVLAPFSAMESAPGMIGQLGKAAGTVGSAIDPVAGTIATARAVGRTALGATADVVGSPAVSGAGGQAIREAASSGYNYGQGNPADYQAFQANASKSVPPEALVAQAKNAVSNMRAARSAAYTSDMANLGKDPTALDFTPINTAIADVGKVKNFNGQDISPSTVAVRNKMADTVQRWQELPNGISWLRANPDPATASQFQNYFKSDPSQYLPGGQFADLDPNAFHSPSGMDALKQKLGDTLGTTQLGLPEYTVAKNIYNAVKGQIVQQAPAYAATMQNYSKASDLIHEMESTLSLKTNASVDTQLRKLQSVMRDNVNTNYGARTNLAQELSQHGASTLMPSLAGQSLSTWGPRGLAGLGANIGLQGLAYTAAAANPLTHPLVVASLLAHLPKVVGQVAARGGILGGVLDRLPGTLAARLGYQTSNAQPQ